MKTERRHELKTNVLAHSLVRWIDAAKPYSRAGTAIVIALVVALFAWAYLSTQNTRRLADGWNEYFDAIGGRDPDSRGALRDISSRYAGTMVGQWARLTLADIQLDDGTNRLLQDRKIARDGLREASEKYRALLLETSHPTIRQRSLYGLARAQEALGELDEAQKQYRELAEQWPDGPFAAAAKARTSDLEKLGTKEFYDWLARYEPPPPLSNQPGKPGARPDFLSEPDAGDILKLPPLGGSAPSLPSLDTEPAADQSKAGEPANESKPAAEPPADPAPEESPAAGETGPKLK